MNHGTYLLGLLGAFVLAACQPSLEGLPELPAQDTSGLLPVVSAQLETARAAVVDDPGDADKNGAYGMALQAYGHSEAARTLYQRARQLAPKDPRWPFYQSAVLQRLGDLEASLTALDDALRLRSDHIDVMAKRGEALFLLSRLDEAEKQVFKVLAVNPDYPLASFYAARIKQEREDWELAAARFEDLLRRGLNVREVHQSLGTIYRVQGKLGKAESHLLEATRDSGLVIKSFDPVHIAISRLNRGDQPHLVRAREHYYRGKLDAAETELLAALDKNPDSVAAHSHLLRIYAEKSMLAPARTHFERVAELEPNNAVAYASWGLALGKNGRHSESIIAFRRATELEPADIPLQIALAGALGRAGQNDETLEILDAVLEVDANHFNARVMRANALLELGRYESALVMLKLLEIPENDLRGALILRSIARAQRALGQHERALESLTQAATIAKQQNNARLTATIQQELQQLQSSQVID